MRTHWIDSTPARATFWIVLVLTVLAAALLTTPARSTGPAAPAGARMPAYDTEGRLLLPEDHRRWVFVGSSLALSYAGGRPSDAMGHEMFHEVLMEPSAYDHWVETGTFREGTMFVLMLHDTGEGVLPSRSGRFAAAILGVEMAVKDSARFEGSWAYFGFGGMGGIRAAAAAEERESCQACHAEHAAHDNVFLQFYPLLVEAGPEGALPSADPAR
jgi:hypothetical protein